MTGEDSYGEEGYTMVGKEHYVRRRGESPVPQLVLFLLGGAVGALAALLLAPQSGKQTRHLIKEASVDVKERLYGYYEMATDRMGAVAETGKDLIKEGRPLFTAALEAGREAFEKERERIRQQ